MKKTKLVAMSVAMLTALSFSSISVSADSVVTVAPVVNNESFILAENEPTSTAAILKSGECGENATWTLDKNMQLTISGTGDMYDFVRDIPLTTSRYVDGSYVTAESPTYYTVPWVDYASNINSIVISDGITHIGDLAFAGCTSVKTIVLPGSVTSIGDKAFANSTYGSGSYISYYVYTRKSYIVIPPSVVSIPETIDVSGRVVVCASDSQAEISAILNGLPYITVDFDENNNPTLSDEEILEAIYQKGIEVGAITTTATWATTTRITTTITNGSTYTYYDPCDCNQDGLVNVLDLLFLKKRLLGIS